MNTNVSATETNIGHMLTPPKSTILKEEPSYGSNTENPETNTMDASKYDFLLFDDEDNNIPLFDDEDNNFPLFDAEDNDNDSEGAAAFASLDDITIDDGNDSY